MLTDEACREAASQAAQRIFDDVLWLGEMSATTGDGFVPFTAADYVGVRDESLFASRPNLQTLCMKCE